MPVVTEVHDSRRLTGPNLLGDGAGAVIDGTVQGVDTADFVEAWRSRARQVLEAVGWNAAGLAHRRYDGGVTVFFTAPIDALYAATELNEWAWAAATSDTGGPAATSLEEALPELLREVESERNPSLLALASAAESHGVSFLSDDELASVGTGRGSLTWPVDDLPVPDQVPWSDVHDVPRVLITGTNGKTTTVRMLASIARAAGRTTGFTCTDGIYVANELLDGGDWSGPGGARAVLRNRDVDVAILETARGGMLRRGLAVDRANAALVANVAADHLGEWGILSVEDVATAKLVVGKAVRHGGPLLVNADDEVLAEVAERMGRPIHWYAVDRAGWARAHTAAGGASWSLQEGWLTRERAGVTTRLVEAAAIPATLGGAAAYNVSNALGALGLADSLDLADDAIRAGLLGFEASPTESPGRGNLFETRGVRVLVDFVHNAHGFAALARTVASLRPNRVGLMIGQAGDRDDESIRQMVRAAWGLGPERIAIKAMPEYARGRPVDEVPRLIRDEFEGLGADEATLSDHDDEVDAAAALLAWSRAGDLVLLSTQSERDEVLELVRSWTDAPA